MSQIQNIHIPVDSLNSVIAEQLNLRQEIAANNQEQLEMRKYVDNLISTVKANTSLDNESSSTSSSSTLMKSTKSVESIDHIDVTIDDGEASLTGSPACSVRAFAEMSAACKPSVTDDILQQLYAINTRIDANIKVGNELQQRWSELESAVTDIKNNIVNITKELEETKQYIKIENLLFHNFRLPFG